MRFHGGCDEGYDQGNEPICEATSGAPLARSHARRRDVPGAVAQGGDADDYGATLADIKQRVLTQRLRVVIAANAAMIELYWDIGRTILDRQRNAGLGGQGHRPALDRLARGLSRHAGVLAV